MDLYWEDYSSRAARRRVLVQAIFARAPVRRKFRLIGIIDVLEHIPAERGGPEPRFRPAGIGGAAAIHGARRIQNCGATSMKRSSGRAYELDGLRTRLRNPGSIDRISTPYMMPPFPLVLAPQAAWIQPASSRNDGGRGVPQGTARKQLEMACRY